MNFLPRCKHIHKKKKKKKDLQFKNAVNYYCLKRSEPVCRRNKRAAQAGAPAPHGARAGKLTATRGTRCPQQAFLTSQLHPLLVWAQKASFLGYTNISTDTGLSVCLLQVNS